jgi:hypothetical protein
MPNIKNLARSHTSFEVFAAREVSLENNYLAVIGLTPEKVIIRTGISALPSLPHPHPSFFLPPASPQNGARWKAQWWFWFGF